jgi:DNA invertase Pin-like site-specific DNA recombinase
VVPTLYDDGGFSGGTMQRPGLKRLIADIEAGQIDVIGCQRRSPPCDPTKCER